MDNVSYDAPAGVYSKDMPRLFTLSTRTLSQHIEGLVITLSPLCFDTFLSMCVESPMVHFYQQLFGFKKFESTLSTGFGFEKIFHAPTLVNGQVELVLPLTRTKSPRIWWARSPTLSVILSTLEVLKEAHQGTNPERTQLFTLSTRVGTPYTFGAPIHGFAAPAFVRWISENANDPAIEKKAVAAMERVWVTLGKIRHREHQRHNGFSAKLKPSGLFYLQCPGDTCEVGTYPGMHTDPDGGKQISCQNLDTPNQQLSLMAGLARLHELADQDLFGHPHTL